MSLSSPVPDSPPGPGTSLDKIRHLANAAESILGDVRDGALDDEPREGPEQRRESRGYKITEVARLLGGRTPDGIRKAEKTGRLEAPRMRANGHRAPYSLAQINAMRDLWDLRPGRGPGDDPVCIAFQNFKGGVGKSTLSTHCAQYLARAGYRVLLIDCDSQASTTMTFGYRPDTDIDAEDTLLPFFENERDDIAYAVRATHWDGLDLVPSNLELYSAEYFLAAQDHQDGDEWIGRLERGIATVSHAYDVVIVDPPPALGMISLSVLRALDGLVVPTPPAIYDFSSTASFLRMLEEVVGSIEETTDRPMGLEFVKVLLSKHSAGRAAHEFVSGFMSSAFGGSMLRRPFVQSAEVDNATAQWRTVYDLPGPTSSRETYKRCLESLDSVFAEVETLVRGVWQSRAGARVLANGVRPDPPPATRPTARPVGRPATYGSDGRVRRDAPGVSSPGALRAERIASVEVSS